MEIKGSGHDGLWTHEYDFLYVTKNLVHKSFLPIQNLSAIVMKLIGVSRVGFLKVANKISKFIGPSSFYNSWLNSSVASIKHNL